MRVPDEDSPLMADARTGLVARLVNALRRRIDPEGEAARIDLRKVTQLLPDFVTQTGKSLRAQRKAVVALEREVAVQRRTSTRLASDVGWMPRAVSRQRRINAELLRIAGLDEKTASHVERLRARLERLAQSDLPVIVGPWTGEVGFGLLYWIPFLQWVRQSYPLDPQRLIVLSRGGVRSWYGHVGGQYVETFDITTPEAYRAATEAVKKQRNPRAFEKSLLHHVLRARDIRRFHLLHPALMYELFWAYWAYRATLTHVDS